MGARPEQRLSMSSFFTPWLAEDDDDLAPWLRAGVEDVLRDDTDDGENIILHDEKHLSSSRPDLVRSGKRRDESTSKNINGTMATYLTDLNVRSQQTIGQALRSSFCQTTTNVAITRSNIPTLQSKYILNGHTSTTDGTLSNDTDSTSQAHCLLGNLRTAASLHHDQEYGKQANLQTVSVHTTTSSEKITPISGPSLTRGHASTSIFFTTDGILSGGVNYLLDDVKIAASLHQDQEYVDALQICCIHELCGKKCTIIKCSEQGPLLCQNFRKGSCELTEFAHPGFTHVHILPNCSSAVKHGQCLKQGCRLGHDNIPLRKERVEEKREKELWWARLCIRDIKAAMKTGATPLDVSVGESSYSKLRGKIGQFSDVEMARRADEVLARYRQYCRRHWR